MKKFNITSQNREQPVWGIGLMKKIAVTGMALVLLMFMGTCGDDLLDGEIEYTDVVYSEDGTKVTVYLNGETVPVTRAQRALTRELALMTYDYLEVVFINTSGVYRNSWELGKPAGIDGNGIKLAGSNYGSFTAPQRACLFAGKKSDKTLFGVGGLATGSTSILPTTDSVTFELAAIQIGLLAGSNTTSSGNVNGAVADSFTYITGGTGFTDDAGSSKNTTLLNGVQYPTWTLSKTAAATTFATYTFSYVGGGTSYNDAIRHNGTPLVQKRAPRFMYNGRYWEPDGNVDTKTTVGFRGTYPPAGTNPAFGNVVPLLFTAVAGSGGVFSFYLQIPVVNLSVNAVVAGSGGTAPITWYIRTGLGSELYTLDDGATSGGCVFMTVGATANEWIDLEWTWLP